MYGGPVLFELFKIANKLDKKGLYKEADLLDYLFIKLAMTREEALSMLGLGPSPSEEEIKKAHKRKTFEHHPDRGGDPETMKLINVARDVLLEKRPPEYEKPEPAPNYYQKAPEPMKITWEEAMKVAQVPTDVKWRFKTDTGYSPYLGDTATMGFVVYGESDNFHIFVSVFHKKVQNAFTGEDTDKYIMEAIPVPKTQPLSEVAPGVIRDLWKDFEHVSGYNAKVQILPEGTAFDQSLSYTKGHSMSFKDAMALMGEQVPETWKKRKADITLQLGYPEKGGHFGEYTFTFIANGKPFKVNEETAKMLNGMRKLLRFIFGDYYYADSKKNLTRMPAEKKKVIFEHLIKHLEGKEDPDLISAFKSAVEQIK